MLRWQHTADPSDIGADQLLIRLKAAGVNPIDTKLRQNGLYFADGLPAILGCDGAGIVEKTGTNVSDFSPGDAVYFCYGGLGQKSGSSSIGNYAELNIIPACAAAKKPAFTDFPTAAAAPLVLITAWEALFDRAGMQKAQQNGQKNAQKVFIHGGAGGVGHVAVQLAKIAGCDVATSVSSAEKAAFVRQLGADFVINYHEQDVPEALLDWTQGQGVDIAFDTVGGDAFCQLIPAVRIYGDLVTILQVPDNTDWKTLRLRNIRLSQELMLTPMVLSLDDGLAHQADILTQCAAWMDEGKLSIHLSHQLALQDAAEAHRLIESGGMHGKIALLI
ncbi:MAG: zinc-binding dehydrogenase [Mariprofundaceae bacterium]|nr:zinc-binding dehydrogenase [Mariprofundaceae bacterium]